MIKVGTTKGFEIYYDENRKLFLLQDAEGNEVASGATQDDVESKAKKLSTQNFKFPIPAFAKGYGRSLEKGRVTSLNSEDRSVYFSYDDKSSFHSHSKLHLGRVGAGYNPFEITEANTQIYAQVQECHNLIEETNLKIEGLLGQLEKPIDLVYFGLNYC